MPQFTIPKRLKVHNPYPISSSKDCANDTKHDGLILHDHINYNHGLPATCFGLQFPTTACSHAQDNFLQSYNYTWIMPNNILHSSMLWQKYSITFIIASAYFLFKPVCNRNKTFIQNSTAVSYAVTKHGRWCKLGYPFLVSTSFKSLYFSTSKFDVVISYLH